MADHFFYGPPSKRLKKCNETVTEAPHFAYDEMRDWNFNLTGNLPKHPALQPQPPSLQRSQNIQNSPDATTAVQHGQQAFNLLQTNASVSQEALQGPRGADGTPAVQMTSFHDFNSSHRDYSSLAGANAGKPYGGGTLGSNGASTSQMHGFNRSHSPNITPGNAFVGASDGGGGIRAPHTTNRHGNTFVGAPYGNGGIPAPQMTTMYGNAFVRTPYGSGRIPAPQRTDMHGNVFARTPYGDGGIPAPQMTDMNSFNSSHSSNLTSGNAFAQTPHGGGDISAPQMTDMHSFNNSHSSNLTSRNGFVQTPHGGGIPAPQMTEMHGFNSSHSSNLTSGNAFAQTPHGGGIPAPQMTDMHSFNSSHSSNLTSGNAFVQTPHVGGGISVPQMMDINSFKSSHSSSALMETPHGGAGMPAPRTTNMHSFKRNLPAGSDFVGKRHRGGGAPTPRMQNRRRLKNSDLSNFSSESVFLGQPLDSDGTLTVRMTKVSSSKSSDSSNISSASATVGSTATLQMKNMSSSDSRNHSSTSVSLGKPVDASTPQITKMPKSLDSGNFSSASATMEKRHDGCGTLPPQTASISSSKSSDSSSLSPASVSLNKPECDGATTTPQMTNMPSSKSSDSINITSASGPAGELQDGCGTPTIQMMNMPSSKSFDSRNLSSASFSLDKPEDAGGGTTPPQMTNTPDSLDSGNFSPASATLEKQHVGCGTLIPQIANASSARSSDPNHLSPVSVPLDKPEGCGDTTTRQMTNMPSSKSSNSSSLSSVSVSLGKSYGGGSPTPELTNVSNSNRSDSRNISSASATVGKPRDGGCISKMTNMASASEQTHGDGVTTLPQVTNISESLDSSHTSSESTTLRNAGASVEATSEKVCHTFPQNSKLSENSPSTFSGIVGVDRSIMLTTDESKPQCSRKNLLSVPLVTVGMNSTRQELQSDERPVSLVLKCDIGSNNLLGSKDIPEQDDSCSDAEVKNDKDLTKTTSIDSSLQSVLSRNIESFALVKDPLIGSREDKDACGVSYSLIGSVSSSVVAPTNTPWTTTSGHQTLAAINKTALSRCSGPTEGNASNFEQPASPSTRRVIATAELDKDRQQLILLLHANQCQKVSYSSGDCGLRGCLAMKELLVHTTACHIRRDCPFPQCSSSRQLLTHYHNCIRCDCTVCVPVKQAERENDVAISLRIQSKPDALEPNSSSSDCYESRQKVQSTIVPHVNHVAVAKHDAKQRHDLSQTLLPVLMKLYRQNPKSVPFKQPVDPNKINLLIIRRKLFEGQYKEAWEFIDDIWRMFDNAWLQNRAASRTYKYCTKLAETFSRQIDPVMRSLGYCCGQKYVFEPQILRCHGRPLCIIPRKAKYWICTNNKNTYCQKCLMKISGVAKRQLQGEMVIRNDKFLEMTNDLAVPEKFVECEGCEKMCHQICVLHHDEIWPQGFMCRNCLKSKELKRERNQFTAKRLPRTKLGNHIEDRVNAFLRNNDCGSHKVTIRLVSNSDKICEVKPEMKKRYVDTGEWPESFPYRAKTLLAFQKVEGDEICFFGMYVQEYGSRCGKPNTGRVHIAYLDSVNFFRPKDLRTDVYHEIVLGYLEFAKRQGYKMAHIWASPPAKDEDYIFHCHPVEQKIPTSKHLQEWYKRMLAKGTRENIVTEYKDILKQVADDNLTSVSQLPYLQGDFWPIFLEESIQLLPNRGQKRKAHSVGESDSEADDDNEEPLHRNEQSVKKMEQNAKSSQGKSRGKSTVSRCANDLWETVYPTVEKYKEVFFVVHLNSVQDVVNLSQIKDPDPPFNCGFMDDRDEFLSLARQKHYEFSSVRRAKYSTMAILYELHRKVYS